MIGRTARFGGLVLAANLVLALAGCGAGDTPGTDSTLPASGDATTPVLAGQIVVFEAASLTDSFAQIAEDFMVGHPGVTVTLNPASSSALAQQITAGSPADVFASASPATMTTVTDAGLAHEPVVFTRNRLEIAVPPGNPGGVAGLADFAKPDLTIALCAEEVPCGAAALKAFAAAGVTPAPDTLEQDVRATLTKVELGEVDAALVYRTDVISAGSAVEGIEFPESDQAINDYQIAVLKDAPNRAAAEAFVAYVRSDAGIAVLSGAGFDVG